MQEYLTEAQIEELMNACTKTFKRYAHRNKTMVLVAYQHGLRNSELCNLTWHDVDLQSNKLFVRRVKNGFCTYQPMSVRVTRALHKVKKDFAKYNSNYVFVSQMGFPVCTRNFRIIIKKLGEKTGLGNIYPHILRHSCGYHLANQGIDTRLIQDYLGHKDIDSTVVYTKTNPERFKEIKWRN